MKILVFFLMGLVFSPLFAQDLIFNYPDKLSSRGEIAYAELVKTQKDIEELARNYLDSQGEMDLSTYPDLVLKQAALEILSIAPCNQRCMLAKNIFKYLKNREINGHANISTIASYSVNIGKILLFEKRYNELETLFNKEELKEQEVLELLGDAYIEQFQWDKAFKKYQLAYNSQNSLYKRPTFQLASFYELGLGVVRDNGQAEKLAAQYYRCINSDCSLDFAYFHAYFYTSDPLRPHFNDLKYLVNRVYSARNKLNGKYKHVDVSNKYLLQSFYFDLGIAGCAENKLEALFLRDRAINNK